jgi:hypothetical protein
MERVKTAESMTVTKFLSFRDCLLNVRGSLFDQSCDFLHPGDVKSVTGIRDVNLMALGSLDLSSPESLEGLSQCALFSRLCRLLG